MLGLRRARFASLDSRGGCPYIPFLLPSSTSTGFPLIMIFAWSMFTADAVLRPRQELALGRPGRRRLGLHKHWANGWRKLGFGLEYFDAVCTWLSLLGTSSRGGVVCLAF